MWKHTPIIPALRIQRQENHYRFEDSLVYIQVAGLSGKQQDLSKERKSTGMEEKRERERP